jgi:hypothetical protein
MIEDDIRTARDLMSELEKKFDVLIAHSAEQGIDILYGVHIDVVVLDVMLQAPVGIPPERTSNGLDAGLWLLEEAQGYLVSKRIPVLVYTNRLPEIVNNKLHELNMPYGQVQWKQKQLEVYFEVPFTLERMLLERDHFPGLTKLVHLDYHDRVLLGRLVAKGVETLNDLNRAYSDPVSRDQICHDAVCKVDQLADLFDSTNLSNIPGIGYRLGKLIRLSGVLSVFDMVNVDGGALLQRMNQENMARQIVYRVPSISIILRWKEAAVAILAEEGTSR